MTEGWVCMTVRKLPKVDSNLGRLEIGAGKCCLERNTACFVLPGFEPCLEPSGQARNGPQELKGANRSK